MRTSTATRTSSEVPLQRLDGDDEVEGRELVLRGGKLSPRSSPAFDPSERRQRQPIHPIPVSSVRVDQKDGPQRVIGGNANVQNSTNAKAGSQTLENPSATNFLTNSAPIYNQNVNSGSGQQNIKVIGNFEVPSSYTPTAAPPEYEIPFESEHNEKRGSGLQKSNVSNGIKNKTAGDDRPNGYRQILRLKNKQYEKTSTNVLREQYSSPSRILRPFYFNNVCIILLSYQITDKLVKNSPANLLLFPLSLKTASKQRR
ncbi:unnamed protein product [Alternaria alternata]